MEQNKSSLNRKIKTKLLLTIILCIIMIPLIVGFVLVKGKAPAMPEATTVPPLSEAVTTAEPSVTTASPEPASDTPTPTTAPTDRQAIVASITDENWQLAIINLAHKLPDGYVPVLAPAVTGSAVQLDSRVAEAYAQMYAAAKAEDCILTPYAGYHSLSAQESTYSRRINYYLNQGLSQEEATARTQQRVLPSGCSEHNAGIAIDIVSASSDFVSTKEYQWLLNHAQDYGFILRYPENKIDKTGILFEPWHWRFVGVDAAKEMKQSGECLEEYLGIVS